MVDVYGHSSEYLHGPCPKCGFATRFKQWPTRCACNRFWPKEKLPWVIAEKECRRG